MDAGRIGIRFWRASAIACLALAGVSCSSGAQFGDVISPVGWLKSTTDTVSKVFGSGSEEEGPPPPPATYPDLNTVPVGTVAPSTPSERERLLRELEQDRSRWLPDDPQPPAPRGTGKRSSLWPNAAPASAAADAVDDPPPPAPRETGTRSVVQPDTATAAVDAVDDPPPPAPRETGTRSMVQPDTADAAVDATREPAVLVAPSPHELAPVRPVTVQAPSPGVAGVVWFAHGATQLSEEDRWLVARLAAQVTRYDLRVRIVGHASARTATGDAVDALLANFRTSLERARSVAEVLAHHGVPRHRVTVEAASAERSGTGDEAGSRRADIFLETS